MASRDRTKMWSEPGIPQPTSFLKPLLRNYKCSTIWAFPRMHFSGSKVRQSLFPGTVITRDPPGWGHSTQIIASASGNGSEKLRWAGWIHLWGSPSSVVSCSNLWRSSSFFITPVSALSGISLHGFVPPPMSNFLFCEGWS